MQCGDVKLLWYTNALVSVFTDYLFGLAHVNATSPVSCSLFIGQLPKVRIIFAESRFYGSVL